MQESRVKAETTEREKSGRYAIAAKGKAEPSPHQVIKPFLFREKPYTRRFARKRPMVIPIAVWICLKAMRAPRSKAPWPSLVDIAIPPAAASPFGTRRRMAGD
jgi:hypothetical protein